MFLLKKLRAWKSRKNGAYHAHSENILELRPFVCVCVFACLCLGTKIFLVKRVNSNQAQDTPICLHAGMPVEISHQPTGYQLRSHDAPFAVNFLGELREGFVHGTSMIFQYTKKLFHAVGQKAIPNSSSDGKNIVKKKLEKP